MRRFFVRAVLAVLVVLGGATLPVRAQRPVISTKPDTPFKLATFEAAGKVRVGLVLGAKVIDIESAHTLLIQELALRGAPAMPRDMRTLIETYADVAPHLYRIANYFSSTKLDAPFVYDVQKVAIKAPIKYPYNILAIAANYKLHAGEMFAPGSPQQKAANDADQDKEDPVFFAKSPRSCIIDPDESYAITPGRNIDWEGELEIIIGKPAFKVAEAQAHDVVFGYSIMYDLSDRGGTGRRPLTGMFASPNWFAGKSGDRSAPFGPFIVPKEFVANPASFHIVTKVNGVVKQDGDTKNFIWDEAHMVRYLTSILTLYPGDVISSGTPDGVGAGRKPPEFLKPGDVVTIEIDGIGTLRTPMRAAQP
ncbi:MAG TPA: fumarylacetoacetate hydrolase family protein [Vicinamibacterales bacterium]|nr:fumarylacetoacetate hydrolase family protein [Vicinamibacterales bacterium]